MGLLEGAAQPLVGELRVADEVDLADLDLVLAVDHEGDVHHLRAHRVVLDAHVDLGVAESLFGPVLLDELAVLVDDVVRQLAAAAQLELLQQVGLLAARNALEGPVVDPGPLLEEDLQVEAVALDVGADLHVREEALAPQARNGVGDERAGQVDRVALDQTGRRLEHVRVEVLHAVDVDLADVVEAGFTAALHHGGVLGKVGGGFRRRGGRRLLRGGRMLCEHVLAARYEERRGREYLTEIIHLSKSNLTSFT